MKCPRCGHLSEADSSFCSKCGSSLLDPENSPTQNLIVENDRGKTVYAPGDMFGQRYRILEELGKGGMGRVYKARDLDLGIEVALKMIHPEFLANVRMITRFKKEILLAREITHENVVRIYDFGEIQGVKFITMQYIEGQNLKELIRETGQISIAETLRIFRQICTGLISAHKKGIVHRDLKPQNVMIDTNGKVFLTDFGLAKSIEGEELSFSGTVIGTPEYISPEQACGEKPDMRSDIYTLGIILFEMLTGQRPFQAKTALAYIQKHLHENPPPPSKYNPGIPRFLERIIIKCMAKDMAKRFQTVEALMAEMRQKQTLKKPLISGYHMGKLTRALYTLLVIVVVGGGFLLLTRGRRIKIEKVDPTWPRSMTILDFDNHTGKQDLDYWSNAIPVLLSADLSQSKYLRLIPEGQAYQVMKELKLPQAAHYSTEVLRRIAERLKIKYILRGSFTASGNLYKVIVKIWNAQAGEEMPAVFADGRSKESLNSIIDRLTKNIKFRLDISQIKISQDIDDEVGKISTQSPAALEFYTRGKAYFNRAQYREAIECFDQAIEEDPKFAMAYRNCAWAHAHLDHFVKRKHYFQKTIELKDHLNQREKLLAEGDFYGENWSTLARALAAYHELLKIYPDDYDGNYQLGTTYLFIEEFEKAIKYLEKCRQNMDPSIATHTFLSYAYMGSGQYDRAREILWDYQKSFPDHDSIHHYLCRTYMYEGKYDLALQQLAKVKEHQSFEAKILTGSIHHLKGQYGQAERIFKTLWKGGDAVAQIEKYMMLKDLYFERGQFKEGLRLLKQVAEKSANDERLARDGLYYKCLINAVNLRHNKFNEVLKLSEEVIEQAEIRDRIYAQILGWYHHGLASLYLKDRQKSREMAGKIKEMVEKLGFGKYMRYQLHLVGVLAQSQGEYRKAVDLFTRAISLLPSQISVGSLNHARFMESRAQAYAALGQIDTAIREYQTISRLTTGRLMYGDIYARSFYRLGQLYQKKGWPGKAVDNYRRFLEIWEEADPEFIEVADARRQLQVLGAGN